MRHQGEDERTTVCRGLFLYLFWFIRSSFVIIIIHHQLLFSFSSSFVGSLFDAFRTNGRHRTGSNQQQQQQQPNHVDRTAQQRSIDFVSVSLYYYYNL